MPKFVASLTTAALFAHATVGCCWHHAHAEPTRGATSLTTIKPVVHGNHTHGFFDHSHESTPKNHRHDQRGCDEGPCVYMIGAPARDISDAGEVKFHVAQSFWSCLAVDGAQPILGSLGLFRPASNLAGEHCALYLSLRTLRI